MRSSPKPSRGHGLIASSHSTAVMALAVERGQLAAVALELLALGRDDRVRCVRDEPLVREHPLRASDLLAQPLNLGVPVAVPLDAFGAYDGGEDPPFVVRAELDLDAAPPEDLRSLLDTLERRSIYGEPVVRVRPRRD